MNMAKSNNLDVPCLTSGFRRLDSAGWLADISAQAMSCSRDSAGRWTDSTNPKQFAGLIFPRHEKK
jgi:hypothetical protein